MQCTPRKELQNSKGYAIIGGHGSINKTPSTPTTRSSIPTPNSLPPPPITVG
jgi:hypothetical protein